MSLLVAPCSHEAAKHAVLRWHYSQSMPTPPMVKFGVWESGTFVGVVLFSRGATGNLGSPYALDATEVCELTRVALREHQSPVSQIVAQALRLLKHGNPGLRLVVSFADPAHRHHGGIYQAGNWTYAGATTPTSQYRDHRGRVWHERQVSSSGYKLQYGERRAVPRPADLQRLRLPGKHRYLYPLDRAMRRRILPLAQPYPRGGSVEGDTSGLRPEEAGSTPAHRSTLNLGA